MKPLEPGSDHNLLGHRSQGDPHPQYMKAIGGFTFGSVTFTVPQEFKKGIDVDTVGDDYAWTFDGVNNWSWQGNDDTDHTVYMNAGSDGLEVAGWMQYNGTSGAYGFSIDGALSIGCTYIDHTDSPYAVGVTTPTILFVDTSTSPVTVVLPAVPRTGSIVIVKDYKGTAQTNNISVTASQNIDTVFGLYTINGDWDTTWLEYDGTEWWLV